MSYSQIRKHFTEDKTVNNKHLTYFLKVYESGSIKKTADELFISSQGLSKMIRQLEDELEVSLFTRTAGGLIPTLAAVELKPRAEKILNEYDLIKRGLTDSSICKHVLTVVSTLNFLQFVSVRFVEDYYAAHPDVILNLVELSDYAGMKKVGSGEVELAFMCGPVDTTSFAAIHNLFSQRFVAVVNEDHPLAKEKSLTLKQLEGEQLILPSREYGFYTAQLNHFLSIGVDPYIYFETTNLSIIPQFAARNHGIGITLDYIAYSDPLPGTVIIPFEGAGQSRSIYLVKRRGSKLSPEAIAFRDFTLKWIAGHKNEFFSSPNK